MKCMFQDCPLEAEKIVPCEMGTGMTGEHVDVYVCMTHYDLLFNKSVNISVSMEIKED